MRVPIRNKIYLDINVIIDFTDSSRKRHLETTQLFSFLIKNDYNIFISEDMLSTLYYISKDKKKILQFLKVIQESWTVSSFGKDVIKNAIGLSLEKNVDLEDLLQCLCAKENDCEVFLTNDIKFFDCGVKIMSVNEFLGDVS